MYNVLFKTIFYARESLKILSLEREVTLPFIPCRNLQIVAGARSSQRFSKTIDDDACIYWDIDNARFVVENHVYGHPVEMFDATLEMHRRFGWKVSER